MSAPASRITQTPADAPERTSTLTYEELTVALAGTGRPILDEVSLQVRTGDVVGLVGESGSGKSTVARAALGLLPKQARVNGAIRLGDSDLLSDTAALRTARRGRIAMVYQDPTAALNPVRTVGAYAGEQLQEAFGMDANAARKHALELMESVGLREPESLYDRHPHELSGGMLQRVVIAAALAGDPEFLLADEATSALDVSTQAAIIELLLRLRRERGLGMLFISHDLALASAICDRVCVMYAGRIVEVRAAEQLFAAPRHPYSAGLRDSTPELLSGRPIRPIPGAPPSLSDPIAGCAFADRCAYAESACRAAVPDFAELDDGGVACRRHTELDLGVAAEERDPR